MCLAWNQVEWPATKSTQYLCQFTFTQIMYVKYYIILQDTGGESIGNPQCMNNQ